MRKARVTITKIAVGMFFMMWSTTGFAERPVNPVVVAAAKAETSQTSAGAENKDTLSPEARMRSRFPQPVKVSHLIGLPVLDDDDRTIGYVREVVRTPQGRIQLIVPYGAWFGWLRSAGPFEPDRRPVAVPIEAVEILARQLISLDMARPDYDLAPTWQPAQGQPIPLDDVIQIAIGRR